MTRQSRSLAGLDRSCVAQTMVGTRQRTVIPECEVDLKVGGRFYIVMEAGEAMGPYKGTQWPMEAKFTVVEPNSKLAYEARAWTKGDEEATQIETVTELNLSEENGKTKVMIKSTMNNAGPNAQMAVEGMKYGFEQQLNKLTNFLAGKPVIKSFQPGEDWMWCYIHEILN
jgi:uncharacterized protein YndB with AHSA1/START domain